MALTPRKSEVEAVMAAIEDKADLESVAKAAIKASFEAMQARVLYVVATDAKILYGPYPSETEAYNALAAGRVPGFVDEEGIRGVRKEGGIPTLQGKAQVLAMTGPLLQAERQEDLDTNAHQVAEKLCVDCGHSLAAHGMTNKKAGCYVTGCRCAAPKKP